MTTTGDDILEELRQRGADSTLIANNAYVRAADEMAMLRGEIARCRQRGHLLAASLDIARKEIERLRVAEGIVRKFVLWEPTVFDEFFDLNDEQRAYLAAVVSLLEKDGDQ